MSIVRHNDVGCSRDRVSARNARYLRLTGRERRAETRVRPHSDPRLESNVPGTLNDLKGCRHNGVEHLVCLGPTAPTPTCRSRFFSGRIRTQKLQHQPVPLMHYIEVLENCLGRKAQKNFLPLQLGDVPDTFADIDDLVRDVGYRPSTTVEVGVKRFVDWFCEYYGYKR